MQEIRRATAAGTLPSDAGAFAGTKPAEELYDLAVDPHEIHNLADDPAHRATLLELRAEQVRWSDQTADLGLVPEAEIVRREALLGNRAAILQVPVAAGLMQRLRQTASACAKPAENLDRLIAAARDDDPAVRYWALTGVGLAPPGDPRCGEALRQGLRDESPVVRVAAARGSATQGETAVALPALESALLSDDVWTALEAALALDALGPAARPLLPQLQRIAQQADDATFGTQYAPRVARHAVEFLAIP